MYKVLIVEDDELLQRMYGRLFRFAGYDVVIVSDGKEAVEIAYKHKPHLVLLDVMIPSYDGFFVLSLLKQHPDTKASVVVMLTNLNDPKEEERSLQQGAALYIVKNDHDPETLVSLVHNVVQKYYT